MSSQGTERLSRARTVTELHQRLAMFFTEEGYARGLAFTPQASDVLIATFPKCGTTWMQQIVHGLRTGGDMSFEEITCAVPWLEAAADMGIDPEHDQAAVPRCYKTHLNWDQIPKGAHYIHISRDPKDALVSYHRFLEGWFFETGTIDLDTLARESFLLGRRDEDYWEFLLSWWERRNDPNVLFLFFEDMKEDLKRTVEEVARFMQLQLDDTLRDIVLRQSGMAFMKAHERQFDDHPLRQARDAACGLPPGGVSTKVDKGSVGRGAALSRGVLDLLDSRWTDTVGKATGASSYAELRAQWGAEKNET